MFNRRGLRSPPAHLEHPCKTCLAHEDVAVVDGKQGAMCHSCGTLYCGACNVADKMGIQKECPICLAPLDFTEKEKLERMHFLVHGMPFGRYTPFALFNLGCIYVNGKSGVEQDSPEAFRLFKLAAGYGNAHGQYSLGTMYAMADGVPANLPLAFACWQLAAQQDVIRAMEGLKRFQEEEPIFPQMPPGIQLIQEIPKPDIGEVVTVILLSSASATKYNGRTGQVAKSTKAVTKGRVAVLLEGEENPISFKCMNLLRAHLVSEIISEETTAAEEEKRYSKALSRDDSVFSAMALEILNEDTRDIDELVAEIEGPATKGKGKGKGKSGGGGGGGAKETSKAKKKKKKK